MILDFLLWLVEYIEYVYMFFFFVLGIIIGHDFMIKKHNKEMSYEFRKEKFEYLVQQAAANRKHFQYKLDEINEKYNERDNTQNSN